MSKENVREFYVLLSKDADLQRRFREKGESLSGKRGDGAIGDEHLEELFLKEILPIAREAGFEFSFQDLQEYSAESKTMGELMDEEMVAVAGGADLCVCLSTGYGSLGDEKMVCWLSGSVSTFDCLCAIAGFGKL